MNRLKNAISLFLYGIKLRVINIPFLVINILLLVYALLDIEALMQKPIDEMKELYNTREIEK